MDADKNMNAVLEQTLQEIHSTIWGRFIDENNIMLDYTDPEGKISLPRFHGANCITPVFFLQKTRFGNGNKTIAGFQTPAQTALFACSHMPEKPAASFGLFTGARGLEGARLPRASSSCGSSASRLQPIAYQRSRNQLSRGKICNRQPGGIVFQGSGIFRRKRFSLCCFCKRQSLFGRSDKEGFVEKK